MTASKRLPAHIVLKRGGGREKIFHQKKRKSYLTRAYDFVGIIGTGRLPISKDF